MKKTILIIDDEENFCKALKRGFKRMGDFETEMAFNGIDGFRKAKEIKPDLIILDVLMPGLNGLQVLRKIKDDPEIMGIPVIMLSGMDAEEIKAKASGLYNEQYLSKPIDLLLLKTKIDEILGRGD